MTTTEQNKLFAEWISEHGAMLHHVANGFAEGADRADLLQELLLAVWKAVPAFRSSAQPSTFIFRVAHNAALTWKRAQRNYRQRVERFESMEQLQGTPQPSETTRERDRLEHLYAAIRKLAPLDRSLVLLQLEAVPYAEIALIHGLTETNVGARLSRAKKTLTELMKEISHELC